MKIQLSVLALLFFVFNLQAENENEQSQDTIQSRFLNEVIVSASTKETNALKSLPGSISFITPQMIEGQKINTIKDISSIIPNFFIANYGSKLSAPVYIRGIGERSTGQSIGMYVDNMPYLDKSVFDFEFMDVQRIEVLRGPQGTLYGRNAMSGIINIFTHSPLDYNRTKLSLSAGNHGLFRAKASVSKPLTEKAGIAASAYYDRNDGFFTNDFNGEKVDHLNSAGARLRFDWQISPNWTAQWIANYDHNDQGAFPYGAFENKKSHRPNHNFPGTYTREIAGTNLNLQYKNDKILFNSSTGFLYFDDDMKMDIDYSPLDVFTNNQLQNGKSWTEELTIKSNISSNYQWSFGVFGFHHDLKTDALTTMGKDGIATILQKQLDDISENNPRAPKLTVLNDRMPIPGVFDTPSYGGAIFHQSTYNNFLIEGLSLTAGLRLDYEKVKLDYNSTLGVDIEASFSGRPIGTQTYDTILSGNESMTFTELLPKVALKYEFDSEHYVYATIGNGYKTGGYNIQMFAHIAQNALRTQFTGENFPTVSETVSYKPEYSWNYEAGFKGSLIKDFLFAEIAAFYIDVEDMQITGYVESGHGRIIKNAGKARSIGFDLSLSASITQELRAWLNYGFTKATFTDYEILDEAGNTISYNGNYVPFAPGNTVSLGAVYSKGFRDKWIDRMNIQAQINGVGKIYWTEENTKLISAGITQEISQDFYGLLNMKASVGKGIFDFSIWGRNLLNTNYTAFYLESDMYKLGQAGNPLTCGIDLSITF